MGSHCSQQITTKSRKNDLKFVISTHWQLYTFPRTVLPRTINCSSKNRFWTTAVVIYIRHVQPRSNRHVCVRFKLAHFPPYPLVNIWFTCKLCNQPIIQWAQDTADRTHFYSGVAEVPEISACLGSMRVPSPSLETVTWRMGDAAHWQSTCLAHMGLWLYLEHRENREMYK